MKCSVCKENYNQGQKFCGQCGNKLALAELERGVIDAAIRCYYTDGTDDIDDGSYMRGLYRNLESAVRILVEERRKQ